MFHFFAAPRPPASARERTSAADLGPRGKPATGRVGATATIDTDEGNNEHPDLATFFSAANPITDAEKALVGAYWMQYRENAADIETMSVNTKLKHLGYALGNATRAFDS